MAARSEVMAVSLWVFWSVWRMKWKFVSCIGNLSEGTGVRLGLP